MCVGDFVLKAFEPIAPDLRLSEVLERLSAEGFLTVMEGRRFVGILTQADALRGGGERVADRLRPIPGFQYDVEITDIVDVLIAADFPAFPVFDAAQEFVGVITPKSLYTMMKNIAPSQIKVKIVDVHGASDFETVKSTFLSHLYHQTKNPLQKIISTVSLLREEQNESGRQLFCSVIEANAKQIDLTINSLSESAFRSYEPP